MTIYHSQSRMTSFADLRFSILGAAGSIGVFLWGTDSTINHEVFARELQPSGEQRVLVTNIKGNSQVAST